MSESHPRHERLDIYINPSGAPAHNMANRLDGTVNAWFEKHSEFPLAKLRGYGGSVLATFPLRYLIKASVSAENVQNCLEDLAADDDVRLASRAMQATVRVDFNDWP